MRRCSMRAVIHVRYATGWRYDAIPRAVRIGALVVPVSSPRLERLGSWWLRRIDGETWEIAPHCFGAESLRPCPVYGPWGAVGVVLTNTPDAVSLELEQA